MPKKLDLVYLEDNMPPLTTPESCQQRIELLSRWGLAGLIPSGTLQACVRLVSEWRSVEQYRLDVEKLTTLQARVKELESELAARPRRVG